MIGPRFRPEIEAHIQAGHFNIYSQRWMNNRQIWYWQKGGDTAIQNAFATQREAEDAALAWYNDQAT